MMCGESMICDVDDFLSRTTSEARAVLYHEGEGNALVNKTKAWIEQNMRKSRRLDPNPRDREQQRKYDGAGRCEALLPAVPSVQKRGLSRSQEVSQEKVLHPGKLRRGIQVLL